MPNSFSAWELIVALVAAVVGFFVSFAPHVPHSRTARAVILITPFLLLIVSQYLWATTGRGLLERVTCVFLPSGASCLPAPPPAQTAAPTGTENHPQTPGAAPLAPEPSRSAPPSAAAPSGRTPAVPPVRTPTEQHAASPKEPRYIALTEANAKDIWSTSVYSYAPGGGGPGGGLENDKLRVGGWGDEYVALLQFDLPDVPCTSTVVLELYNNDDSRSPTSMRLQAITTPWDWRKGDRLWWKDLPGATNWQNLAAPEINAWMPIDITRLFRKWCTREMPNYGLMLRPEANNNNYDTFYSTRGPSLLRPRLVVTD